MRDTNDAPAVTCPECGGAFVPRRSDQEVCGATCRQRRHRRGGTYVVTEEDRAAIRRVLADGCGHPLERPLTPEEIRRHVELTAERT
jgi:hypothetical protein